MSRIAHVLAAVAGMHAASAGTAFAQSLPNKALPRPGGVMTATDNRLAVDLGRWPWSSIGRVNLLLGRVRAHCTGTLVGPRHVLTAAHCLLDRHMGRWAAPHQIHFVLGQVGDRYAAHATIKGFEVAPEYGPEQKIAYRTATTSPTASAHDWAILELEQSLSARPVGWRSTDASATTPGETVFVTGYRADRAYQLSVEGGCKLSPGPEPNLATHPCSAVPGESGGPVLAMKDGGAEIVALSVAFRSVFVPGKGHVGVEALTLLSPAFDAALRKALGR